MTDIEKIINGDEELVKELEYQTFNAKSTTSSKTGTLWEFTIVTGTNRNYVLRVFENDADNSVTYSGVEDFTTGRYVDVLDLIKGDPEEFKNKAVEFLTEVISEFSEL